MILKVRPRFTTVAIKVSQKDVEMVTGFIGDPDAKAGAGGMEVQGQTIPWDTYLVREGQQVKVLTQEDFDKSYEIEKTLEGPTPKGTPNERK